MTHHNVHISQTQANRLRLGHTIQLKHPHISGGGHSVRFHPENHKKILKAKHAGRGVRIQMSPEEWEASGLREIWNKIKSGAKYAYNKAKPFIRPALKAITQEIPGSSALVDLIGNKTGAFGIEYRPKVSQGNGVRRVKRVGRPRKTARAGSFAVI